MAYLQRSLSPEGLEHVGWGVAEAIFPLAEEYRLKGVSHKGFQSGSVALAVRPQEERRFCGANFKPFPGNRGPRCCGEDHNLKEIGNTYMPDWFIRAFVLDSDHQPDDESGIDFGALVPCKYCRKKFRWHIKRETGLITPSTQIFSQNRVAGLRVHLSVGELLKQCPDIGATYERFPN